MATRTSRKPKRAEGFRKLKTATIRGRKYKLKWCAVDKGEALGAIDWPSAAGKRLRIDPNQTPFELLGTVIHEVLHGAIWDLDEAAVCDTEMAILSLLHRMGMKISFSGHEPKIK